MYTYTILIDRESWRQRVYTVDSYSIQPVCDVAKIDHMCVNIIILYTAIVNNKIIYLGFRFHTDYMLYLFLSSATDRTAWLQIITTHRVAARSKNSFGGKNVRYFSSMGDRSQRFLQHYKYVGRVVRTCSHEWY